MDLTPSKAAWVKFGKIKQISFVGKETICIGSGCHMLFINITTGEEALYHADNKSVGEGVRTFSGHKTLSVFAFAEKCRFPRVFIMTCPNFGRVCLLNKGTSEDFMVLAFSEGEFIITLNDTPSFKIIVWSWRKGEKIAFFDTDIFGRFQLVRCNLSTPIYFAQIQTGHTKLNLWDLLVCGKKCVLTPHRIEPTDKSGVFSDMLWTSEGTLFVLDMLGNAYALGPNNNLTRVIEWEGKGCTITSFTWYKAGLTIAGPNGTMRHFKKSGDWICDWHITPPVPLKSIVSNYRDILIGISEDGEIVQHDFAENSFKFIKRYQSKFNDLCMIYPAGEYFVTLQHNREVTSWELTTGEMKNMKILKGKALAIKENPEYPYVGVAYDHGVLELLSLYNPSAITTMASFNISKYSLNSVYFTEVGKLIVAANTNRGEFFIIEGIPGSKMEILATVEAHHQICDYMLVASRTCMRLFALYINSDTFIAGNKIVRFCIIRGKHGAECKEYKLETSYQMYSKLYATTKINRDRVFYAIPLVTKCIHEISTKRGDPYARVTNLIPTGHQMKKILLHIDKYQAITYAYDGLVIIRNTDFTKRIAVVMPHYRTYGGVFKAYVSPLKKYIVSLGRDHALVGTTLTNIDINANLKEELDELVHSPKFTLMFKRPTVGFSPTGEFEGLTWFEMETILQERREQKQSELERLNILEEFKAIQEETQALLTQNLEGPENERLDVQEFNLDVDLKEIQIKKSQDECKYTKIYLEALIAARDKVSNWIKNYCWNQMRIQGQIIRGMFSNFQVSNYVLLPYEEELLKVWHCATVYRKLERQMAENDIFEPWVAKSESELNLQLQVPPSVTEDERGAAFNFLEDEEQAEEIPDADTETAFKGSVTHYFVEPTPGHYTQQQISTFLQSELEALYCLVEVYKLKEAFNKQFEEVMSQKVREMSLGHERIARLRHILSELNYFSVNKINITIEDPLWSDLENPDTVLRVLNKEVGITPYISPSEQAMLDAIAAEEERLRLLLLADDFRERALMAMMNGVLEVRWEDELRKDVPKPKCMLEKEPEEFNEEDLRAVMQYEEDVRFLNSERERYKKMLEAEYAKLSNNLRDSVRKFNRRLADFLLLKIQTDSGIRQENLKLSRVRSANLRRIVLNKKEQETLEAITYNHSEVEVIHSLILSLQVALQELKANADVLLAKDKQAEKVYKKDFNDVSSVVQEQSVKLYKKRPKASVKNITSSTLILETAKCVITHERTILLTQECLDYLKSLDALDSYVNIPPAIDENIYGIICKHRRLKIESELRMKALALQVAEAENTVQTFQKLLQSKKEYGQKLLLDLDQVRNDRLLHMQDIEIQLILKQGIVELSTSGRISDFDDAVMVSRKDVETINKIILRGGSRKIKAMKETMTFRRGIIAMEWQHRCLRMQIADLHTYIENIESVKVTKEIQAYLKSRARGYSPEKALSFEEEVEAVRASYMRIIDENKNKVKELQKRINILHKQSSGPQESSLDAQIKNVNIDVCEYQLQRDFELEKKEKHLLKTRMATFVKRAQLTKQIQQNHGEILLLQTELELKRQKKYPTLSYKILP